MSRIWGGCPRAPAVILDGDLVNIERLHWRWGAVSSLGRPWQRAETMVVLSSPPCSPTTSSMPSSANMRAPSDVRGTSVLAQDLPLPHLIGQSQSRDLAVSPPTSASCSTFMPKSVLKPSPPVMGVPQYSVTHIPRCVCVFPSQTVRRDRL